MVCLTKYVGFMMDYVVEDIVTDIPNLFVPEHLLIHICVYYS